MTRAPMLPRMLDAASTMPEFTARTLAESIGVPQKHVADLLGMYHRRGSRQFRRLRKDGRYWVYTTLSEAEYAPVQEAREAEQETARRIRWLAEQEASKKAKEAKRKERAAIIKARSEEWKKDHEAKNAERRARIEAILKPYGGCQKTVCAYIGERITFRVPVAICTQKGWKRYTRFSILIEPGKITLHEAGEDHTYEEKVLDDSRQISIPVRLADQAGWHYGDVIAVDFKGGDIILQKVVRK